MDSEFPKLPKRDQEGHKGIFGTLAIIGGHRSDGSTMFGGTALCALGALRTGVGKCILVMPDDVLADAIKIVPQAIGMSLPKNSGDLKVDAQCILVGPAFGLGEVQTEIVKAVLKSDGPKVLDADALNALAEDSSIFSETKNLVLTPHIGEFKKLVAVFEVESTGDQKTDADSLARKLACIIVLKDSHTYITDGTNRFSLDKPNSVLATAGSGDLLAGIIGGLIAQHFPNNLSLFECCQIGVAIHNETANIWKSKHGDRGVLIVELAQLIPEASQKFI